MQDVSFTMEEMKWIKAEIEEAAHPTKTGNPFMGDLYTKITKAIDTPVPEFPPSDPNLPPVSPPFPTIPLTLEEMEWIRAELVKAKDPNTYGGYDPKYEKLFIKIIDAIEEEG